MKKQRSMRKQLFRVYTLLFLVLFLLTVTVSLVIMVRSINTSILETQKRIATTITVSVEGYFEDMSEFSTSLVNSDEFKKAVLEDLPESLGNASEQSRILRSVYKSVPRMFEKGYRIGVATKEGIYIWLADQVLVERLEEKPDVYDDYIGYGRPEIFSFLSNAYLSQIENGESSRYIDTPVLSLSRSINRNNYLSHPQAILEVQVDMHEFEAFVDEIRGDENIEQLQMTIYGHNGGRFYGNMPLPDGDWKEIAAANSEWARKDGNLEKWERIFGDNIWIRYQIPEAEYYQKLWSFLRAAVTVFVLVIVVMIYCTWQISRKVSKPLTALNNQLKQLDLAEPKPMPKVGTRFQELEQISETISALNMKLYQSMQQILLMKTAEVQSRLMALTSQMQPHFLYNTLAVIRSLSQQGENERVANMCNSLSQMLRYVSVEKNNGVLLYEEISFLKHYTMIMKERFPAVSLHLDIPLEMMDIRVPKLILQPVCENSFKYAGRNDVEIWVKGSLEGNHWIIQIKDNGIGFSAERIAEILIRCRRLLEGQTIAEAGNSGMGLPNIYARLAILYGKDFVFTLDEENGVTIGGKRNAVNNED